MNPAAIAKKYGKYVVDDQEFVFFDDAVDFARRDFSKIRFSMYGKEITQFDCSSDPFPGLSLQDLYRSRAQEIRDNYDYIVLGLSGGPDSSYILDIFTKNNIPLDEIINFNNFAQTGEVVDSYNNADFVYNVDPKIKELQKNPNFKTKITIIDQMESATRRLTEIYKSGHDDWLRDAAGGLQHWNCVAGQLVEGVPHLWKMLKDGKKVALISGQDKPISFVVDGKRFQVSHDANRGRHPEWLVENQIEPFWEWFYQSDIRIVKKQCYLLQNFVSSHPDSDYYDDPKHLDKNKRFGNSWPNADGRLNLKHEWFHGIIYPGWKQALVTAKDADMIIMPRHNPYLFKLDPKLQSMWFQALFRLKAKMHPEINMHGVKLRWQPDYVKSSNFLSYPTPIFYDRILLR